MARGVATWQMSPLGMQSTSESTGATPHFPRVASLAAPTAPSLPSSVRDTFINRLPVELKLRIFSLLSPHELLRHVSPVCRVWNQLARDPLLWTHLDLSSFSCSNVNSSGSYATLCRIIKGTPLLRHLNLSGWGDLDFPEIEKISSFVPGLEEIHLGFCHNIDTSILGRLSLSCPNLKLVNLEGCRGSEGITNEAIRILCENLSGLETLNVSHCSSLTDEFVVFFARSCHAIKSLNADGIPWLTDLSISILTSMHGASLRELRLDGEELTDSSVHSIGVECPLLVVLDVAFCDLLTDQAVGALRKLHRLEHLRLKRGTGFSSAGLKTLFQPVDEARTSPFPHLRVVGLPECSHLDNEGLQTIVLGCGATLRLLNIAWCWDIDDVALEIMVRGCPNLTNMELLGLKVLEGSPLAEIHSYMPKLLYLGLQQCNRIDDDILIQLARAKPSLHIVNYYGERITPDDTVMRFMADGAGVGGIRPEPAVCDPLDEDLCSDAAGLGGTRPEPSFSEPPDVCLNGAGAKDACSEPVLCESPDDRCSDAKTSESQAHGDWGDDLYREEESTSSTSSSVCDKLRLMAWAATSGAEADASHDAPRAKHSFHDSSQIKTDCSSCLGAEVAEALADPRDESGFDEDPSSFSESINFGLVSGKGELDLEDDALSQPWDWVSI